MPLQYKIGLMVLLLLTIAVSAIFSLTDISGGLASAITATITNKNQCINILNQKQGTALKSSDVRITPTHLNRDNATDYIIQKITEDNCGSAGCIFELCLGKNQENLVQIVPFGLVGNNVRVKDTITNDMKDLQLLGNSTANLQWDGARYVLQE